MQFTSGIRFNPKKTVTWLNLPPNGGVTRAGDLPDFSRDSLTNYTTTRLLEQVTSLTSFPTFIRDRLTNMKFLQKKAATFFY